MCHDSPYYWLSKHPATVFFSTLPSGLSSLEQTSWILYGGGQELWNDLYDRFNLLAFPSGNADFRCLDGSKRKLIH